MATTFAEDLTAPEFAGFIDAETVGILPVAAIEPHGPHLPLSTDCDIARGHLLHLSDYVAEETNVLILPLQTIGHSLEHAGLPGVFTHRADNLLTAWTDVVRPFYLAGGRRLIVVSSHGGNSDVVGLLVTQLRAERGIFAVTASWLRFGQPNGLFDERELAYGIHGGDVETSLMMHYWPDSVRIDLREDFVSRAEEWEPETAELSAHGKTRPGWLSVDLHPSGAVGNALAATAGKGAASAGHILRRFGELIADVAAFDLSRLRSGQ